MTLHWTRRQALCAVVAGSSAGCGRLWQGSGADGPGESTEGATPDPIATPDRSFDPGDWHAPTSAPATDVERNVLVENMEVPWDVSVAPNGDLFVTERVGRVTRFAAGDLDAVLSPQDAIDAGAVEPGNTERPWWVDGGEGGTLGVAIHPEYPDVPYLFLYYTARVGGERVNRLSRFDVSADDPAGTERVLVDDVPASKIHNGGRLTFGPEGYLWVTTGDGGQGDLAADPGSLAGKVLRVTVDGRPAPGNPDIGSGADPRVVTYGHRNPQGLVWLPDGTPVASEHGPNGRDEVNRIVPGHDYGWPRVREREDYEDDGDVHPPLASSGGGTTWAPTGSCFYTGDAVLSWRNRLLVGGLVSQQLLVVTLTPPDGDPPPLGSDGLRFDDEWYDDAYTATVHPVLQDELGRIRHVEQGLDGELYVVTSNRDGRAKAPFPREVDDVLVRIEGP